VSCVFVGCPVRSGAAPRTRSAPAGEAVIPVTSGCSISITI
jgi:hypothetical protein